jgi:hypothetical protein
MWISKKKYNELVAQRDDFERIASNAVAQNGRILDHWKEVMEEMHDIQRFNHVLVDRNEKLAARCKELEAELDFAIKQRDYYYDLLEDTSEVEEKEE